MSEIKDTPLREHTKRWLDEIRESHEQMQKALEDANAQTENLMLILADKLDRFEKRVEALEAHLKSIEEENRADIQALEKAVNEYELDHNNE